MTGYRVRVMDRKSAEKYLSQTHRNVTALISVYGTDEEPIGEGVPGCNVLAAERLCFDDVDRDIPGRNGLRCISERQALRIARFVDENRDRVKEFIVHCGAGISRSAGAAAAIMKYLNGSDSPIFDSPGYQPNMKVYRTVLNALFRGTPAVDACRYLNSKDVAEYCRSIGYRFGTLETVFAVGRCRDISIEEKHRLYRRIMETMPDAPLPERMLRRFPDSSVFALLGNEMNQENELLALLEKGGAGAVYSFAVPGRHFDEGFEDDRLYSSFGNVIGAVKEFRTDEYAEYRAAVTVRYMDSERYIRAFLDGDNRVCFLSCSEEIMEYEPMMYEVWVQIPTPFRRGDILWGTGQSPFGPFLEVREPMVLTGICCWDKDDKETERCCRRCDSSDMTAFGRWLDTNGNVYDECVHSYQDLEYCTEPLYLKDRLTGRVKDRRLLKKVSEEVRGEL